MTASSASFDTAAAAPTPPAAPPYLRSIPPRSRARQAWDRFGWNLALLIEIVAIIVFAEVLISGVGLWDPAFVPPPSDIFSAFTRLASRDVLLDHIWFSLSNFAVGYLLAAVVGVVLGLLLGTIRAFRTLAGPLVWIAYSTPRVALAPLIIMWLGFGAESKIAVIFLLALFPIVINVWTGAGAVDPTLLRAGQVFGGRRLDLYRKVILPYILPYTLTGLRLGIARGLVGVVVAEFIGSAAGIGYMIKLMSSEFDLAAALVYTLVLMITANVAMVLLDAVRRRVAPWYRESSA